MRCASSVLSAPSRCLRKTHRTSSHSSRPSKRRQAKQPLSLKLLRRSVPTKLCSSGPLMTHVLHLQARSTRSLKIWPHTKSTNNSLTIFVRMRSKIARLQCEHRSLRRSPCWGRIIRWIPLVDIAEKLALILIKAVLFQLKEELQTLCTAVAPTPRVKWKKPQPSSIRLITTRSWSSSSRKTAQTSRTVFPSKSQKTWWHTSCS